MKRPIKILFLFSVPLALFAGAIQHSQEQVSTSEVTRGEMMSTNENIVLYMKPNCPYCQKVFRVLNELNIDINMVDISEDPSLVDELISLGGKKQVPCIVIEGKPMYESDAIVDWLRNRS